VDEQDPGDCGSEDDDGGMCFVTDADTAAQWT
jgi:hypothetical protein